MSFWNRISNWVNTTGAKIYAGVRNGIKTGYNAVQSVAHKIGDVASGVDGLLNRAKDIPIIGEVADVIKNNSVYKDLQNMVGKGVKTIDDVGKVGSEVDSALQKVLPDSFKNAQ